MCVWPAQMRNIVINTVGNNFEKIIPSFLIGNVTSRDDILS